MISKIMRKSWVEGSSNLCHCLFLFYITNYNLFPRCSPNIHEKTGIEFSLLSELQFFWYLLKPMYSFGRWWIWKISLMAFVYRVVWVLKALWIFMSETINFLRNGMKLTLLGCPQKFDHRVMYRAASSGHISLNFNMPFKFILRRFEVVFWCLEWDCCTLWETDGKSFKSTNTILWL